MNTARVTSIRSAKKEIRPLGESINLILDRIKSKNTAKNYKGFYKEFFTYTFNKSYMDTTWEELINIGYDDVLEYVGVLETKNNPKTVATKIASIQSLVKELSKINTELNPAIFNVKIDTSKTKKNEYGAFTEDEIYALLDYAKSLQSEKAYVQYMFFKLSVATAHRLTSLLDLTWNDIECVNENGTDIWVLNTQDKTGHFSTPISNELYSELYELYEGDMNERVLKITDKTLSKTLASFCKENNIDQKGRKLVLHSIKKCSGDIAYRLCNGDIVKVANHLHHSNINTCYQSYLSKNKKLTESHSYNMFGKQDNIDELLSGLSKDDLVNLIKKCSQSTIHEICKMIKEEV